MIKALFTSLLLFVISPLVLAQGDPIAGKSLTTTCAACHGQDGNSTINLFPKLAGQQENYLLKQLQDIQSGKRVVPQMTGQLNALTQQDLSDIAAYFAHQTIKIGKAKPDLVEQGEQLFRFGDPSRAIPACSACHGPAGRGINSARYPALNGQFATYTASQLRAFQQGLRHNDPNNEMQSIAQKLNNRQIDAVSSYLAGLKAR